MPVENKASSTPSYFTDNTSVNVLKKSLKSQALTAGIVPTLIAKSSKVLLNTIKDIQKNNSETSNVSNKEILKASWKEQKNVTKSTLSKTVFARIYKASVNILNKESQKKTQNLSSVNTRATTNSSNTSKKAPTLSSQEIKNRAEVFFKNIFANNHIPKTQTATQSQLSELLNSNAMDTKTEKEMRLKQKTTQNILESFPEFDLRGNLQETVAHICAKHGLTQEDILKEARFLGDLKGNGETVSKEIAMMKMVNRLALYKKSKLKEGQSPSLAKRQETTGYEPSIIKGVEKLFKQHVRGEVDSSPKQIGKFVAMPTEKGVILEEKFAGAGSFKAAILASDFFAITKPEDRMQFVTLKPKSDNQLAPKEDAAKATIKGNASKNIYDSQTALQRSQDDESSIDTGTTVIINQDDEESSIDTGTTVIINQDDEESSIDTGTTVIINQDDDEISIDTGTTVIINQDDESSIDTGTTVRTTATTIAVNQQKNTSTKKNEGFVPEFMRLVSDENRTPPSSEKISWNQVVPQQETLKNLKVLVKTIEEDLKNPDLNPTEREMLTEKQNDLQKHLSIRTQDREIMKKYAALADTEAFEAESYTKEVELTQQLQGEGIVKMHAVIDLNSGNKVMIQEAAGYRLTTGKVVVDLEKMDEEITAGSFTINEELQVFRVTLDAFKAVSRLHDEGYILRDLKEENILVTKDGKGALADFGCVVKKDGDPKKSIYEGSPLYSSPESCRCPGSEFWNDVTEKSDVWSCGVILHRLTTGEEAHPGIGRAHNPEVILNNLAGLTTPRSLAAYNERYPEPTDKSSIEHLIWSATRVNPDERPTMAELCKGIESFIKSQETSAA